MTVLRHYLMTAAESKEETLDSALRNLANKVRSLPGCSGVELYRDTDNRLLFFFFEKWASLEAYQEASKMLDEQDFADVFACLAHPPAGRNLVGGEA